MYYFSNQDICLEEPSGFEKPAWSKALKEFVWDKTVVWNELERVPDCLLLHTKKIDIKECYGLDYELELIKYLLKNCEVLESMIIHNMKWTSKEKKRELCQEILVFERRSKTCQVKFTWYLSLEMSLVINTVRCILFVELDESIFFMVAFCY